MTEEQERELREFTDSDELQGASYALNSSDEERHAWLRGVQHGYAAARGWAQ